MEPMRVHELHNKFDLVLKIRAKDLKHMRDIIDNKIRVTNKKEQSLFKNHNRHNSAVTFVDEFKSYYDS